MPNFVEFAKCIKQKLSDSNRDPHWESGEAQRYMAEVGIRHERFEQLAVHLIEMVIQPRLETLASYFVNASPTKNEPVGHCSCWFGYCDRFPSSTKVALAVEHDVRYEKVVIAYAAMMTPVFIKFNEHDKLTLSLTEVNDGAVGDWVESRLLEFLDAYLRIDRGSEDLDEEAATDPVCGMRISRSSATASAAHLGHPYYFCSTECQAKFSQDPTLYVQVKTM